MFVSELRSFGYAGYLVSNTQLSQSSSFWIAIYEDFIDGQSRYASLRAADRQRRYPCFAQRSGRERSANMLSSGVYEL